MTTDLTPKQPSEVIPGCYVDFTHRLLDGENVTRATVTGSIANMIDQNSIAYSNGVVSWTTQGGASGDTCVITVVATGSKGSVREAEVQISVIETP